MAKGVGRSHVGEKEWSAIPIPLSSSNVKILEPGCRCCNTFSIRRVGNSFRIYKRNSLPKATGALITSRRAEWGYIY